MPWASDHREVWGMKPHHREEGFCFIGVLLDELHGPVDDHSRVIAIDVVDDLFALVIPVAGSVGNGFLKIRDKVPPL